jgi:hypothetical protein
MRVLFFISCIFVAQSLKLMAVPLEQIGHEFSEDNPDEFSEDNFDIWVKKEPVPRISLAAMKATFGEWAGEQFDQSVIPVDPFSPLIRISRGISMEVTEANDCEEIWKHTYIHRSGCHENNEAPQGVLVTSTGRSGTDFLHDVFRMVGLDVAHDAGNERGRDGSVSWPHAFNSNCKLPRWSYGIHKFFNRAHLLVRSPLKQIASRSNNGHGWPNEYPQCVTMTQDTDFLGETLEHWVLWNTFAKIYAESFVRVEDLANNQILWWASARKCVMLSVRTAITQM